jgi:hypothetical protein
MRLYRLHRKRVGSFLNKKEKRQNKVEPQKNSAVETGNAPSLLFCGVKVRINQVKHKRKKRRITA